MPAISPQTVEEVKPIQGRMPDSVEEHYVAVALYKLDIKFSFQWIPPIFVAGERGSTVVDFLIEVPPRPVPLYVDGAYWHSGPQGAQDEIKRARLFQQMHGRIAKHVSIQAGQLKDQAAADTQMRMLFGSR